MFVRVWVFDLFISMGKDFLLALDYVQNLHNLNDFETTGTRYLLLLKKVIKIQIQFKIQFLV